MKTLAKALMRILYFLCTLALVSIPCHARANDVTSLNQGTREQSETYTKDRVSIQVVSGALFSPFCLTSPHPVFNYVQTNLRIGRMLDCPTASESLLRGNFEVILELTNSVIYKGSGNYIGGFTALIRYNLLQPNSRFIPYVQTGAGIVYTDAYKDHSQTTIGQAIEFTLQASLGLHYLIDEAWSIDAEAMFHHISNAGLSERNHGLNAVGGFIGLTYFYDQLWK